MTTNGGTQHAADPLKARLPFLDGIRGIAILAVFLFHGLYASFGFDRLPWDGVLRSFDVPPTALMLLPVSYGLAGVAVFFVVSGFCIHLSHQRNRESGWLGFAGRRFFRIYPPYLLAVGVFCLLWLWVSPDANGPGAAEQLGSHLLGVHNFSWTTFYAINPSFWSIAVELQLYLLYPLLLLGVARLGWRGTLLVVGAIEVAIQGWCGIDATFPQPGAGSFPVAFADLNHAAMLPWLLAVSPLAFWLSWSLGAYLADGFLAGRSSRLFAVRFDVLALVAVSLPFFRPVAPLAFLAFAWLTAVAIERLLTGKWRLPEGRWFQAGWSHLSLLGVVSFSFYLFHQPFLMLTQIGFARWLPDAPPAAIYAACLGWYPVVLGLSCLLYRYVERPSVRLGQMLRGERHGSLRAVPGAVVERSATRDESRKRAA